MTFYNTKNLSYLFQKNCSVVITGDSLAYNRYDFVDDSRMNAWECPFAMKSWSFLLRDYMITRSRGWVKATDIEIEINSKIHPKTTIIKKHDERVPLNEQMPVDFMKFTIMDDSTRIILKGCPENICFITELENTFFTTDETKGALKGNPMIFDGKYYKWIQSRSGILENITKGALINMVGAAETKTEVFLTGSGSKTAEWLLKNADERIFRHNPDLCILLVGANNRRMNDPESFKGALNELLERLQIFGSEIIIISPPHSTTTDPAWNNENVYQPDPDITKPILDILKRAAFDYDIPYMDLFEFFRGIPSDLWRFDNTHFTKQGNLMLYDAIIESYFEGV